MSDIHNTSGQLQGQVELLKQSDFSDNNVELILEFKDHELADSTGLKRVKRHIQSFRAIEPLIDFDLDEAEKRDLVQLVALINQDRIPGKDYEPSTRNELRKSLKAFYKWQKNAESPEIVDFITCNVKKKDRKQVDPARLPGVSEVERLMKNTKNPRDKAFIVALWESGGRIGEVLSLKWSSVTERGRVPGLKFEESKTWKRVVPVKTCMSLLENWKQQHPDSSPENHIFSRLSDPGQISYNGITGQLKDAAERASVEKKVNPQAFRQSRACYLASQGWNVFQLMEFFGWDDPETALYYIKIAQSNVEEAFIQTYKQTQVKDFENSDASLDRVSTNPEETPQEAEKEALQALRAI